jgi:ABC-2 type transport system permease protein
VSRVRAALAYTTVILRQLSRDKAALFFMLVLPVGIITIIGTVFGGTDSLRVAVVAPAGDELAARVVDALDVDGVTVVREDDLEAVRRAIRRDAVAVGVVVADGFGAEVRAGRPGRIAYVVDRTSESWFTERATVDALVQDAGVPLTAAAAAAGELGAPFDDLLTRVDTRLAGGATAVAVVDVGDGRVRDLSRFALTAPQQLVLFVFVNSLGAATALVVARRTGVIRRAFATRTSLRVLLVGVLLAWFAVAMVESVFIVVLGRVLFGVRWGDPMAAAALVTVFAAACTGAGLVLGTLGRNEDRVSAIGPATGMVLGALGGCMVPLEVFPPAMVAVARLTPHYWGVTAWEALVFDGDGLVAILPRLGVLAGFAVVLVGVATVALRRELTRGG